MSAWIKCTTMFDEIVYLNMADARIITPLATGLSRVTFRQARRTSSTWESATDLIAAAKAAAY